MPFATPMTFFSPRRPITTICRVQEARLACVAIGMNCWAGRMSTMLVINTSQTMRRISRRTMTSSSDTKTALPVARTCKSCESNLDLNSNWGLGKPRGNWLSDFDAHSRILVWSRIVTKCAFSSR